MSEQNSNRLTIKTWAAEDRPREKLERLGPKSLSQAELIAILLGSGNSRQTAVELAQEILNDVHNNLYELGNLSLNDLQGYHGIGIAKAVTIAAAMELGRRRREAEPAKRPRINNSRDTYKVIAPYLLDLDREEFWIIVLNHANDVLGCENISTGGTSQVLIDAKIIFRKALEKKASRIILCHNHPSGTLQPSKADIALTKKLQRAGKDLDIPILDHLIVAGQGFYSFSDAKLLEM